VVAAAVAFDLWTLRAERTPVPYENDLSIHTAMVQYAAQRIADGQLPWTGWFPNIGLGSAQFLHYQSLPAVLNGIIAQVISPQSAVSWSTYLLLGTWPLSVYISARLFSLRPWEAAWAAAASPFLSTVFSSGYEQRAYIFLGYGLWTQLFAMWTLPIAWGLTWRAITDHKRHLAAAVLVALTVCFHFETGYLALAALIVFPFVSPRDLRHRLRSALLVGAGALALSAWEWVPLFTSRRWSAVNSVLAGTPYQKGYGLHKMLYWLITGRIFDYQAVVPVVTGLGAIGFVLSIARWRRDLRARVLVTIGVFSFLLECGTTTFGPLSYLVPGHQDIYFRRFAVGFQMAWLLLAGVGLVGTVDWLTRLVRWRSRTQILRWAVVFIVGATIASGLGAQVQRLTSLDASNQTAIAFQVYGDKTAGAQMSVVIAKMKSLGPGRVYAGTTTNWGARFTVGEVPVYKYLETQGLDVMVYSPTTTTLMDDPEYYFNPNQLGEYELFGIRYIVSPSDLHPDVPVTPILEQGYYALWQVDGVGYGRVVDTVGSITENRADIAPKSVRFMGSNYPTDGQYLTVSYSGAPAARPTQPRASADPGSPGRILSESDDPASGAFTFHVNLSRRAVVVLSETYDPGWSVFVDGHRAQTEILAPALVGVVVGPGLHTVNFEYTGFGAYGILFGVAALVIVLGIAAPIVLAYSRRRRRPRDVEPVDGFPDPVGELIRESTSV
jgi:hypothetical protein